jgi:leucyl aminopeptidase (aminopeptidase T)
MIIFLILQIIAVATGKITGGAYRLKKNLEVFHSDLRSLTVKIRFLLARSEDKILFAADLANFADFAIGSVYFHKIAYSNVTMKRMNRRYFLAISSLMAGTGLQGGRSEAQNIGSKRLNSDFSQEINSSKLLENASIVLEVSCRAKAGETLLILQDDVIKPYSKALSRAAINLGLVPAIFDIRDYLATSAYTKGLVLPSLKGAIESSDIVIQNLADTWVPNRPDYGRLTGNPVMGDAALTSERRWLILQSKGMEAWNISRKQVTSVRERTIWLMDRLKRAKKGRITSINGTDFTFGLGQGSSFTPILGIIPFYGEVAVVPDLSLTNGTFVVDGPTQRDVRPRNELNRVPFKITVEAGKIKAIEGGDPEQIKRLKAFISSGDPVADCIDEIGLVTTGFIENDRYYWSDGTHHHDTVHIALGNNAMRNTLVHGPKHMDCEILKPTISIDELCIIKEGIFHENIPNL